MNRPPRLAHGPSPIIALARQLDAAGRDVIHLEIGEPDFATPAHIVEAGVRALRDGATRYVAPEGLPSLRAAIASAAASRGVSASPDEVIVTSGAKPMLLYAVMALASAGDDVLVPDPGYPGYASAALLAGARPVPYPIGHERGEHFRVDLAALEAAVTPATRVMILNSPHNPTGMVLEDSELAAIAELALRHDLWIVSDEVYAAFAYGDRPPRSIAAHPGMAARTLVVNSFSKTYAMTGWRLGFGIMPSTATATIRALVSESTTCAAPFVQQAGIAALAGPQDAVEAMRAEYRSRRDAFVTALQAIGGVRVMSPAGAFYAFADVTAIDEGRVAPPTGAGSPSMRLAERLLREQGVACMPGRAYGARGEGYLRFSFASPGSQLRDAVRRIDAFTAGMPGPPRRAHA